MSQGAANMGVTGESPGLAVLLLGVGSTAQALRLDRIGPPVLYLRALIHEKENNLCSM